MSVTPRCLLTIAGAALLLPTLALAKTTTPLVGEWAGDRIALVVTPEGARIMADCADGTIDGPLVPDRLGRFQANGHFDIHQPGPQRGDDEVPPASTRFTAVVNGKELVLTITYPGGTTRRFTLVRDAQFKRIRCL